MFWFFNYLTVIALKSSLWVSFVVEYIMRYLLFLKKKQQNLKLSSAANYRWRFKG